MNRLNIGISPGVGKLTRINALSEDDKEGIGYICCTKFKHGDRNPITTMGFFDVKVINDFNNTFLGYKDMGQGCISCKYKPW